MKICTKCHIEKKETDFYVNRSLTSGRTSHCKACMNANNQEYQRNHRRGKHLNKTRCHIENSIIEDLKIIFEDTTQCDFDAERDINMTIRILLRK